MERQTGRRSKKLRKAAQKDPFMADAIEGYEAFPEKNHRKQITTLNNRLTTRTQERKGLAFYLTRTAAAAVFIGLIGTFFWLQEEVNTQDSLTESIALNDSAPKPPEAAEVQPAVVKEEIAAANESDAPKPIEKKDKSCIAY